MISAVMSGTEIARDVPDFIRDSLPQVFGASDFVAQSCQRDAGFLAELIASGDLSPAPAREPPAQYYAARAPRVGAESGSPAEADFMAALRRWRKREMVRIAWRDLAGWVPLPSTLADVSALADAALNAAHDYARSLLVARYGEPRSLSGQVQPLLVVAMGKLGGGELNFSSDIDLVFLFPEHGDTDGPRSIANEEFFTRLGQTLIRMLEARTQEGFVFRVDLRLRPFGASGPLVASFNSFEDYLQRQGRDWERYAWIKARAVTAPQRYAEVYASAVRPFVYRRYLDYGVFQSLREMKALIEREVERRELADDIKLGPGGIREIEFIVQAFQLIRGGQDGRLRTPSLLSALPLLEGGKLLPARTVRELGAAYAFLRRLENCLQMLADEQRHRLPADAPTRTRIAIAMRAASWEVLMRELEAHRRCVSDHFRLVFGTSARGAPGQVAWISKVSGARKPKPQRSLRDCARAVSQPMRPRAARLLLALRDSALARRLDEPGRKRLQSLLPDLLAAIGASAAPIIVLRRILRILEAIGQRSVYFALLHERAECPRAADRTGKPRRFSGQSIGLIPTAPR